MKSILTFLLSCFFMISIGTGQTTLFLEDFEGFNAGDWVSSSEHWDTWSGGTGTGEDAQISTDYNHTTSGANSLKIEPNDDIVYFCGDLTAGEYDINFWYYIPAGQGGYFNIQHAFGSNWAFSVNFFNDGSAELSYDNATTLAFSYTQDTWIPISVNIDINNDEVTLNVESTEVHTWQFSTSEGDDPDLNVLDCVNFYGYSTTGLTPPYYVDDFEFIEVVGYQPPNINLNVSEVNSNGESVTITVTNDGELDLNFEAYEYYAQPFGKKVNTKENIVRKEVVLSKSTSNKEFSPISFDPNSKDEILTHLSGDVTQGLGYANEVTVNAAALYDHNMVEDFIGMEVSNVIIFTQDLPVYTSTVEVYEGFNSTIGGPSDLLSTEEFTPAENGQVTVDLTTPVFVSGKDLWAGYEFTDPGDGFFCIAMDAGPPTEGVNFTKTGVAWGAVNNPSYGNFGIVATLTGTPIETWLENDIENAVVTPGGSQDVVLSFDYNGLVGGETYSCTFVFESNDSDESWVEIPVSFTVPFTYTVTFNVDDGTDPIVGATVSINGEELTTDVGGVASLFLPDGEYYFEVDFGTCDTYTGTAVVDGNADMIDVTMNCPSDIEEYENKNISVYPNPSTGTFYVDIDGSYTLEIIDISGKIVSKSKLEENTNITIDEKGFYILKFTNSDRTETIRIIVE